jgi:adenine phosphoribosyltransferase
VTAADLIAARLRDVPDFPKPGIQFKDISPLLADADAFATVVHELAAVAPDVDVVAGVEARGFLLAGAIAGQLGRGLVPTLQASYDLEYGSAEIEVAPDLVEGRRVLLVDDVLATGGTLRASSELITRAGGDVVAMAVILELAFLRGRATLSGLAPLTALLSV